MKKFTFMTTLAAALFMSACSSQDTEFKTSSEIEENQAAVFDIKVG